MTKAISVSIFKILLVFLAYPSAVGLSMFRANSQDKPRPTASERRNLLISVLKTLEWAGNDQRAVASARNMLISNGISTEMCFEPSNTPQSQGDDEVAQYEQTLGCFLHDIDNRPRATNAEENLIFNFAGPHQLINQAHLRFNIPPIPIPQSVRERIERETLEREQKEAKEAAEFKREIEMRTSLREETTRRAIEVGTIHPLAIQGRPIKVGDVIRFFFKPWANGLLESGQTFRIRSIKLDANPISKRPSVPDGYPNSNYYEVANGTWISEVAIDQEKTTVEDPSQEVMCQANEHDSNLRSRT